MRNIKRWDLLTIHKHRILPALSFNLNRDQQNVADEYFWFHRHKREDNLFSHLPPVSVGLLQENKPLSLPYADLTSIGTAVVVVILGLEDHCTAGDSTHRHPPGGHHRCCSMLLMPHRAPPSTRQHGSLCSPVQQALLGER